MTFKNNSYVNIVYDTSNIRIYKVDGHLYAYTATVEEIIPFYTKSIYDMTTHVFDLVKDCEGIANLHFGYAKGSLSKNKSKKLAMLLNQGSQDCDFSLLSRWITLLV
jgi:hypothetical protein